MELSIDAGCLRCLILLWLQELEIPVAHINSMGAGDQNDTFRGVSPDHAAQHAGLSPFMLATAATYDRERDGLQVLFSSDCMHAFPQGQPLKLRCKCSPIPAQNLSTSGSYIAENEEEHSACLAPWNCLHCVHLVLSQLQLTIAGCRGGNCRIIRHH